MVEARSFNVKKTTTTTNVLKVIKKDASGHIFFGAQIQALLNLRNKAGYSFRCKWYHKIVRVEAYNTWYAVALIILLLNITVQY